MQHEINGWQKDQTIARIVRATFPNYRRKRVWVRAAESITLSGLNWDGGSRDEYRACSIDGKQGSGVTTGILSTPAPWNNQFEGKSVPIPQGYVIVRGGTFCGKDATLCLHVNPSDMPRYLPNYSGLRTQCAEICGR